MDNFNLTPFHRFSTQNHMDVPCRSAIASTFKNKTYVLLQPEDITDLRGKVLIIERGAGGSITTRSYPVNLPFHLPSGYGITTVLQDAYKVFFFGTEQGNSTIPYISIDKSNNEIKSSTIELDFSGEDFGAYRNESLVIAGFDISLLPETPSILVRTILEYSEGLVGHKFDTHNIVGEYATSSVPLMDGFLVEMNTLADRATYYVVQSGGLYRILFDALGDYVMTEQITVPENIYIDVNRILSSVMGLSDGILAVSTDNDILVFRNNFLAMILPRADFTYSVRASTFENYQIDVILQKVDHQGHIFCRFEVNFIEAT